VNEEKSNNNYVEGAMSTQTHDSKTENKQEKNSHQAPDNDSKKGVVSGIKEEAKPVQQFATKFTNDWSMNLSAALAYNLMLATVPIFIVLLSVLGFVLGFLGPNATNSVFASITKVLPPQVNGGQIIQGARNQLQQSSGILGIIGILSALFLGSRLFVLLETFFSIVYRVRPRSFIRQNLMALGMMVLFLILVPIMVLASYIPTLAITFLRATPLGQNPVLITILSLLGGVLASFLFFESIYVVVPNLRIRLRNGWIGAIVAAIALQFYLYLFPIYASNILKNAAGAVGFAVILLVFFYYFAVLLFLGAEINAFFAEKVRPLPNDLATFVSTMAGRVNKDIPADEGQDHVNTKPTEQADKGHVVDYVKETDDRDVPQQVAEDPEVQQEVERRQGGGARGAGNNGNASNRGGSATSGQRTTASSQSRSTSLPNKPAAQTVSTSRSNQTIPQQGIVIGVLAGTVISFLVDMLRLRKKW
jgi:YihY family inner membrane protein